MKSILWLCLFLSIPFAHIYAEAPMAKTGSPGYYRFKVGDFEVTSLSDGTVDLPMTKLLSNIKPEQVKKILDQNFLAEPVETSDTAFLVNTGSKLVLIDTGAGGLFGPTLGKLQNNLSAAGYKPEQVDFILITHFHADHIGGLMQNGKLAFPNAVLMADKLESDYWLS